MEVRCVYNTATGLGFDTGHDQRVAGKADWRCKGSFVRSWCHATTMQEHQLILNVLLVSQRSATTAHVKNLLLDGKVLPKGQLVNKERDLSVTSN